MVKITKERNGCSTTEHHMKDGALCDARRKKILRLQINTCFLLSSVSLEMLYLGGNLISAIPSEVANLPYLTYLVLCDNRIQSVPPQLTR